MRAFSRRIAMVIGWGLLGFFIPVLAGAVWTALFVGNLATTASVPWSVPVMAVVLWLVWQYLGGRWWPRRKSAARRRLLRAEPVSREVFAWALVAGVPAFVALAGLWIVMFQLVKMPGNALPDLSKYPLVTTAAMVVMGSLVAPLSEEAGFRGYYQVVLEREFSAVAAVIISSIVFALGHFPHGLLLPKQFVYFLAGVTFGATAYLTRSILPGIAVHIFGDLTFFTMVWPYDATRRLVWEAGADGWFWIHVAQAIIFAALSIVAFTRLAKLAGHAPAVGSSDALSGSPS